MRRLLMILASSCAILCGAEPVLDTTPRTYVLFLDMHVVEALHNVELVLNQAEKHPANPVLPTGDMNDFDFAQASANSFSTSCGRNRRDTLRSSRMLPRKIRRKDTRAGILTTP